MRPRRPNKLSPEIEPTIVKKWGDVWIAVRFPYNETLMAQIKDLPKRRFDRPLGNAWLVPLGSGRRVATIMEEFGSPMHTLIAKTIMALPGVSEASKEEEARLGLARAASGSEAGEDGAEVVRRVEAALEDKLPDGLNLYPFQKVGVGFMHSNAGRAIIADDMGIGKTIEALAYLLYEVAQGRSPFPCVVIVPAVIKRNWRREAERWLARLDVRVFICDGSNPAPADADVVIINYDLMHRRVKMEEVKEGRRKVQRIKVIAGLPEKPATVIVDEFHKIKSSKSKRTKATSAYAALADRRLLLSGTPLLNRPIELWPALSLLRPNDFRSYWAFAKRYCGGYESRFGWNFDGASNLDELRTRLQPFMLRRTKDQVLTELGPKRRVRLTLELDNEAEYRNAEADLVSWLVDTVWKDTRAQAQEEGLDQDAAEKVADRVAGSKAAAALRAEHLVRMNTLRLLAGRGKIKAALDWIADVWEADPDRKLIVWSHHKEVVHTLAQGIHKRFDDLGIAILTGDTPQVKRMERIDAFQQDPKVRVFLGTTTAGGVGITLTAAHDVLFLEREYVPGDEEQAEDRAHRIGQEATSVTIWYATAEDTIDQDFAELVEQKRAIFAKVVDGKEVPKKSSLLGAVTKRMMKRHAGRLEDPAAEEDLLSWLGDNVPKALV